MDIAERIQNAMEAKGMSQAELVRDSGMPQSTLSRVMSGTTTELKLSTILALCNALDISPNELLGWSE